MRVWRGSGRVSGGGAGPARPGELHPFACRTPMSPIPPLGRACEHAWRSAGGSQWAEQRSPSGQLQEEEGAALVTVFHHF